MTNVACGMPASQSPEIISTTLSGSTLTAVGSFQLPAPSVTNSLSDFIRDPTINTDCFRRVLKRTRTVQPVATCRQSPYVHKPAIVKLLLLIYGFKNRVCFSILSVSTTPTSTTPSPTHSWTHLWLWSPYVIGQTIIFLPCDFYLLLLSFFPRLISAAVDWMSTILPHMVWP